MKIIIVFVLLAIISAVILAGVFMVKDHGDGRRMVNALIIRISLSVGLLGFIVLSYLMGWIQPHGVMG